MGELPEEGISLVSSGGWGEAEEIQEAEEADGPDWTQTPVEGLRGSMIVRQ